MNVFRPVSQLAKRLASPLIRHQTLVARACSHLTRSTENDSSSVAVQALEDAKQLSLAENLNKYGLSVRDALHLDPSLEKRIIIKVCD